MSIYFRFDTIDPMSTLLLQEYVERISRLIQTESRSNGLTHNLQPIQLNALHFLTRANRYSDTPQGVTEYFGFTKGTVSQTLTTLETKGFIKKIPDKVDGRKVHLNVTKLGKKLLERTMPSPTIENAWQEIESKKQNQLIEHLKLLLLEIQKRNGMKPFGVCKNCRHNQTLENEKFFCGLTQENLSLKDSELLCREYQHIT
ncbi:MAG: DNA-binding MarR family transcriptional regulator [Nitrospinales bacterium]